MNQKVKQLWVQALRGGDYKKGIGQLFDKKGRLCCMGVLCHLYQQETKQGEWVDAGNGYEFHVSYAVRFFLSKEVMDWAGLTSHNPYVQGVPLSIWNDQIYSEDQDFLNIVKVIEEHL